MGKKSAIAWTDATWNPVTGCTKISDGCKNCYAEPMAKRLKRMAPEKKYRNEFKVTCHPETLREPLKWQKPSKIFVCSMSDLFHEDVDFDFICEVLDVIHVAAIDEGTDAGPAHRFQILTKRPERMKMMLEAYYKKQKRDFGEDSIWEWPLPNVWLGITAENQEQADKRIPLLLQTPAAIRFVSIEPMLGAIDIAKWMHDSHCPQDGVCVCAEPREDSIDWVIVGGESGPGARPMHPDWVRKVRDDCKQAKVPFFFKQWGEWSTGSGKDYLKDLCVFPDREPMSYDITTMEDEESGTRMGRVGKAKAGSLLDGVEYKEFPATEADE